MSSLWETLHKPNHLARSRARKKKAVSELHAEERKDCCLSSVTDWQGNAVASVRQAERDRLRDMLQDGHGTDCGTSFKTDTAADASVMSLQTYVSPRPPLQKATMVLRSPGGTVDCKGKIEVMGRVTGVDYPLGIYVVSLTTLIHHLHQVRWHQWILANSTRR